jgi:hypothetical protein
MDGRNSSLVGLVIVGIRDKWYKIKKDLNNLKVDLVLVIPSIFHRRILDIGQLLRIEILYLVNIKRKLISEYKNILINIYLIIFKIT